jgi:hypothetical protein
MKADMSAYVYQMAYILTAGLDYDCENEDPKKHITNLSVNKGFANHPGQVPCDLMTEYPAVSFIYERIYVSFHFSAY